MVRLFYNSKRYELNTIEIIDLIAKMKLQIRRMFFFN